MPVNSKMTNDFKSTRCYIENKKLNLSLFPITFQFVNECIKKRFKNWRGESELGLVQNRCKIVLFLPNLKAMCH